MQVSEPMRTQPIGLIVNALGIVRQMIFPLIAGVVALRDEFSGFWLIAIPAGAVIAVALGIAYLSWLRRTYTIGDEDIRVESGIISRTAASVPYERIQDVSLEQELLPRLFGLVSVKFETGAGGAEELKLAFLTAEQGDELRDLIRERREDSAASIAVGEGAEEAVIVPEQPAETLFAMGPGRLFTFGLFEFSLAVFAVLFGLASQFDNFLPFVQAVTLGTRWLRYRFGWHTLKFVSLASDFAGSSHVVAPFAKRAEIDPGWDICADRFCCDTAGAGADFHRTQSLCVGVSPLCGGGRADILLARAALARNRDCHQGQIAFGRDFARTIVAIGQLCDFETGPGRRLVFDIGATAGARAGIAGRNRKCDYANGL